MYLKGNWYGGICIHVMPASFDLLSHISVFLGSLGVKIQYSLSNCRHYIPKLLIEDEPCVQTFHFTLWFNLLDFIVLNSGQFSSHQSSLLWLSLYHSWKKTLMKLKATSVWEFVYLLLKHFK